MSTIEKVMEAAKNPEAPQVEITNTVAQQEAYHQHGDNVQISSVKHKSNMLDNAEAIQRADKVVKNDITAEQKAELDSVLNTMNPDMLGHFKHPRYYAMTGGRSGGRYFVTDSRTHKTEAIIFVQGLYATTEKRIIDMLDRDIRRPSNGIGNVIENITHKHYKEKQDAAMAYDAMLGRHAGAMVTTGNADAHKLANEAKIASMEKIIKEQSIQMEALRSKLNEKPDNNPVLNGNNIVDDTENDMTVAAKIEASKNNSEKSSVLGNLLG